MTNNEYSPATATKIKAIYDYICTICNSTEHIQAHAPNGDHSDWTKGIALCGNCHADQHPEIPRGLFLNKTQQPYWPNISARSLATKIGCHNRTVIRIAKRLDIPRGIPLTQDNLGLIYQAVNSKNHPGDTREITLYLCKRCSHRWATRNPRKPIICPKCKSPYWGIDKCIKKV